MSNSTVKLIEKTIADHNAGEARRDAAAASLPVVPQPVVKKVRLRKPKATVEKPAEAPVAVTPTPKAEPVKPKAEKKVKAPKVVAEKVVKPKGDPKLAVFGHSVTGVIRRLGQEGFSFKETVAALTGLDVKPSPNTVRIFLSAGKSGQRGAPAAITALQVAELKSLATTRLEQAAAVKAEATKAAEAKS